MKLKDILKEMGCLNEKGNSAPHGEANFPGEENLSPGQVWLVLFECRLRIIEICHDFNRDEEGNMIDLKRGLFFTEWGTEEVHSVRDYLIWITKLDMNKILKWWEENENPTDLMEKIKSIETQLNNCEESAKYNE